MIKKIDLYLGGDLGLWVLEQISLDAVSQVFTLDLSIATQAEKKGLKVWNKNVNFLKVNLSDFGFSIHYPRILKPHIIAQYKKIYNLHPSYLPYGRGYYPIFWALWEDTPAGATLHEINAEIDQGNIVAQIKVEYKENDTGGSLFQRVRQAEKELFKQYIIMIINQDNLLSFSQIGQGSYHTKKDFLELKSQINWQEMKGKDLIKLIRCLTFEGYTSLEIELENQYFEVCLKPLYLKDFDESELKKSKNLRIH